MESQRDNGDKREKMKEKTRKMQNTDDRWELAEQKTGRKRKMEGEEENVMEEIAMKDKRKSKTVIDY